MKKQMIKKGEDEDGERDECMFRSKEVGEGGREREEWK